MTNIKSIKIPDSVEKIGSSAFCFCQELESLHIPQNVNIIVANPFNDCSKCLNITVDVNNTNYVAEDNIIYTKDKKTLVGCASGKQSVEVVDGVKYIGARAFMGCERLEKVILPEGVIEIGSCAFMNNNMLTEIVLPESLQIIEEDVFGLGLKEIYISKNVVSIGARAFKMFEGEFNVDENNMYYMCENNTLYTKDKVELIRYAGNEKSLIVPEGVKRIGQHAFNCVNVEEVILPEGLERIGQWAFYYSNIKEITIPKSVEVIEACALYAPSLQKAVVLNSLCEISGLQVTFPERVTFYGYGGSTAQKYANEYEITFEELPMPVEFEDIQAGAYYETPVQWAVQKGITNGYGSNTTFCPENVCTRGQIVTFLWRAKGCPEPASLDNPFTDVASDAYYYKAVLWAVEQGITNGYGSDTIFNPDGECTRGQVATFMWRAEGQPANTGNNPFTDLDADGYYYDAVLWAVEKGVTNGYGNVDTFCPNVACTRGQIVTFLYRGMN